MGKLKRYSMVEIGSGRVQVADQEVLEILLSQRLNKSDYPISIMPFTPRLIGHTVAGSHSYARRTGEYIKFANILIFTIDIALSLKGSDMEGNAYIAGLPFNAKHMSAVEISRPKGILQDGYEQLSAAISAGDNFIRLYRSSPRTGNTTNVVTSHITSDFNMLLSGFYMIG